MWIVKLTARSSISGRVGETVVRIPGSRAHDLLYNEQFKWKHLDQMLKRGSLLRVDIDFKQENGWGK